MHVLVLPSWYFSNSYGDIAGKNFHAHALALREAGINARVFYGKFSTGVFTSSHTYTIEEGVPTTRIQKWAFPKSGVSRLQKWVKQYADEVIKDFEKNQSPEIIHAQSYLAAFVASEIKSRTGIPYVYTEHLSDFLKNSIRPTYTVFLANECKNADLITAVSPGLASMVANYTHRLVEVVPNFYRDDIFSYQPEVNKYPVFTWVTVGEPAYIKGLDLLVKAFGLLTQEMKGIKMDLLIADKVKDENKLLRLVKPFGVDHRVKFSGFLTQNDLAEVLQKSHVYISASRYETFGTSIVEAQACGLPVIATPTAGANFILNDPQLGIFTESDPHTICASMKKMYQSLHTYSHESIAQSAYDRFNRKQITERWINTYKQITG